MTNSTGVLQFLLEFSFKYYGFNKVTGKHLSVTLTPRNNEMFTSVRQNGLNIISNQNIHLNTMIALFLSFQSISK